jgi:hypothetical protein
LYKRLGWLKGKWFEIIIFVHSGSAFNGSGDWVLPIDPLSNAIVDGRMPTQPSVAKNVSIGRAAQIEIRIQRFFQFTKLKALAVA